jgi:hypothetical protein
VTRSRYPGLLIAVLAVLPIVPAVVVLCTDLAAPERYFPYGDNAVIELNVRAVGHSSVLLGPYSRFGWSHPGPLLYYTLAIPYRLFGSQSAGIAIGALLVAAASLATIVFVVRRHLGVAAALCTLLVLSVLVRLLEPGFLRDPWNPELPLLPFAAAVFLCWAAALGDRWALPCAMLPASLAVQSHVGYLVPVAFAGLLGVAGFVLASTRRPGPRSALAAVRVLAVSLLVLVVLWLPALIEQLTTSPGNLRTLVHYLSTASSDSSIRTGLEAVADEVAKLPAYAAGVHPPRAVLLPLGWPRWAAALGAGLFLVALGAAVRWRNRHLLWLAAFSVALAISGVLAVAQISGLAFPYVTQWTTVVGVVWWSFIGSTGLVGLSRVRPDGWPNAVRGLALVPVLASVAVLSVGTARAATPQTDTTGQLFRLEQAVLHDVDQRPGGRAGPVRLDFAGTSRPVIVGTSFPGSGIGVALIKDGVDLRVAPFWHALFGDRRTRGADEVGYVATLAYSDGSSPPPAPGQRVLAVDGEYQIYGGEIAAG